MLHGYNIPSSYSTSFLVAKLCRSSRNRQKKGENIFYAKLLCAKIRCAINEENCQICQAVQGVFIQEKIKFLMLFWNLGAGELSSFIEFHYKLAQRRNASKTRLNAILLENIQNLRVLSGGCSLQFFFYISSLKILRFNYQYQFVRQVLYSDQLTAMLGKKIGKYQVQHIIGEGSFGKVYLGCCNKEQVALKFIPKKNHLPKEIAKIKMEVDLLSKINHLNIITMKQYIQTDKELIVVMQYAGSDLSELLKKQKKLPEEKLRLYAKQIVNAMVYLKEMRIMHRDLKPQNILLQKDTIKICDFGFAKKMSASTQFLKSIKGTPLYLAPEIFDEKPYTDKVDVWSLGVILFQLAIGRTPFMAPTIQTLKPKVLYEPVNCPPSMNPILSQLIKGMLQKRDSMRFSWEQVKSHRFFNEPIPMPVLLPPPIQDQQIKIVEIKWDAEEECAYICKIDSEVREGKVLLNEIKQNQIFWERVIATIGQVCLDRKKIPTQILLKTLKLTTKLIMHKRDPKDNQKQDITTKQTLTTAIVTLALEESNDQLLEAELELIGYLLKVNFNRQKIDTQFDEQITTITSRHLMKKKGGSLTVLCLKVLGILTSQAIWTLNQSLEYFERVANQKLVTCIAQCYNEIPESQIVLQCLQKFIHPRIQRNGKLPYKARAIFASIKRQAAAVLLKNKLITQTSLMSRKQAKTKELQIYCEILLQCLQVSPQMRNEFLKHNYWQQLLSIKNKKLYYLAYVYIILKETGKIILSSQKVQSDIVQEQAENKFTNVFLIYAAYHKFKSHQNNSRVKLQKLRNLLNNVENMLLIDPAVKKKHCFELFGSLAHDAEQFDDVLIQVVYNISKQYAFEEVRSIVVPLANRILTMPLSFQSLLKILQILQVKNNLQLAQDQSSHLVQFFFQNIKNQSLESFLTANSAQSSKLIFYLLRNQLNRFNQERQKQAAQFFEIIQKFHFIELLFSEHMTGQPLVLIILRMINRFFLRLKHNTIGFLADTGLKMVKKYFKTSNQQLLIELVVFCSTLARLKSDYAIDLLQIKVMELVSRCLNQGGQLIKQKTLHLVGNLSKHNESSFSQLQKYGIISAIGVCLTRHKNNRRILKNAVYCIGNISFYSDRFSQQLKPIVKCLGQGLIFDDEHLLQNTLSTISNLLRHSDAHVAALKEGGIIARVLEVYEGATTSEIINFCNNLLKKALERPKAVDEHQKTKLKSIFEAHLQKKIIDLKNQNAKKVMQLLA